MTWFDNLIVANGIDWATALGDLAVRGTVLLAVAGMLALLLRRRPATLRHRVWTLALTGLLSLPVVGLVVPGLELSVPVPDLTRAPQTTTVPDGQVDEMSRAGAHSAAHRSEGGRARPSVRPRRDGSTDAEAGSHQGPAGGSRSATDAPAAEENLGARDPLPLDREDGVTSLSALWPRWVVSVWAIGAAVALGRLLVGRFMRGRLGAAAQPLTDPKRLMMFDHIAAELGLRRSVRLLRSADISVPITWGCWYPVVAVPAASEHWSEEKWRVVLLHELTHVRRGDCLSQLVSQLACAMHWFNPLAWFGSRSLRLEGERACDEEVIRAGTRASDYAEHLLEIAQGCRPRDWTASATVGMARRTHLEGRLLNILEPPRSHAASTSLRYAASAVVGGTILGVAAVQPAALTKPGPAARPYTQVLVRPVPGPASPQVDGERAGSPADVTTAYAPAVAAYEVDVEAITGQRSSRDRGDALPVTLDQLSRPAPPRQAPRVVTSLLEERLKTTGAVLEPTQWQVSIDGLNLDYDYDYDYEYEHDYDYEYEYEHDYVYDFDGDFDYAFDFDVDSQSDGVFFGRQGDATPLDDRVVSAFIAALDDAEADVRRSAVVALGRHRVGRAVGPLAAALSDADAGVREAAARALGRIRSEEAVPQLVGALRDADRDVAELAAVALGRIRSETAVSGLSAALDHEDDDVREQVVRALERIRSPAAVNGLIGALDDSDQRVVRYAIRALARINDERAVEALADAVQHDDPIVRRAAIVALSGGGNWGNWSDVCWDGVDNDGDGQVDGDDSDCR